MVVSLAQLAVLDTVGEAPWLPELVMVGVRVVVVRVVLVRVV